MSRHESGHGAALGIGLILGALGAVAAHEIYKSHLDGGLQEKYNRVKSDVRKNVEPAVYKTREVFDRIHSRCSDLKDSIFGEADGASEFNDDDFETHGFRD